MYGGTRAPKNMTGDTGRRRLSSLGKGRYGKVSCSILTFTCQNMLTGGAPPCGQHQKDNRKSYSITYNSKRIHLKKAVWSVLSAAIILLKMRSQAFLPHIYEPSAMEGRFDYIPADSSAGIVIYNEKFAFSHHATDPVCGNYLMPSIWLGSINIRTSRRRHRSKR